MEAEMKKINESLAKLIMDVNMIKRKLFIGEDPEGELSEWAKDRLMRAREAPESSYVSLEESKKKILAKK